MRKYEYILMIIKKGNIIKIVILIFFLRLIIIFYINQT